MTQDRKIEKMVIAALLCAVGIVIPMFFPRITIEPMSFTLASHVPVILAAFISPAVAAAVSIGTAVGFFFSATPIIALRALSHIVWAVMGAVMLKKNPGLMKSAGKMLLFGLLLAVVHAVCETIVVSVFYFGGTIAAGFYEAGFLRGVLLLVGGGTIVHGMVDYLIAVLIWKAVSKQVRIPVSVRL